MAGEEQMMSWASDAMDVWRSFLDSAATSTNRLTMAVEMAATAASMAVERMPPAMEKYFHVQKAKPSNLLTTGIDHIFLFAL